MTTEDNEITGSHTIEGRLSQLEKEVKDNRDLIQQIKGAGFLLRICFYIVGPLCGFIYWLKQHLH